MESEITVSGATYAIGKLDAFKQFHVARRLAPVLASMGGAVEKLSAASAGATKLVQMQLEGSEPADSGDAMVAIMSAVAEVIAKMPEDDVNYILHACLGVAKRKDGDRWARVMNGASMMYQDIDMPAMMQITFVTLRENLSNFFPKLPDEKPSPTS
jgi:hypothetical protein